MSENSSKILSLRKNEVDVFTNFEQNTVLNIEILRHSVFKCLYSTEDDDTFKNFVSELGEDQIATIHFKKSMIFEKYFSVCSNHHVLLLSTSLKDQINTVLSKIQNCEIYYIDEKDRTRLSKYENSKLLNNFASEEKINELNENLGSRINERFEVFNGVQSVLVCYHTTYMTFFYLVEEVVSSYYDLTPQPLDFPSDSQSSSIDNGTNPLTVIPFYYLAKDNYDEEFVKSQSNEIVYSKQPQFNYNIQRSFSPVFAQNMSTPIEKELKDYSKVLSLRKNEIDVFCDFEQNIVLNIEVLRHSVYQCLYSTEYDDTFKKFVSELGNDKIATIHFKKSMIFEKYFSVCSNHHILLISTSSKDQINEVLSQIKHCEIYCIDEKDQTKLSKYENSKLLNNFASEEKINELNENLSSRINERFEVFNGVQSVLVCYHTTYMTFFYLVEEVVSSYYDLTPQTLDFPSDSQSSFDNETNTNTVIPFYYDAKNDRQEMIPSSSLSNSNIANNGRVASLLKKEIDIFREFPQNQIIELEVLPHTVFRCLYSTENDSTFHSFVSEIKADQYTTVHFKKSMIFEKYFSFCTDHHALLISYESKEQINEFLSQLQDSKIFCVTEKDKDKISNFENHKLLKSFASNDDLEILRETLHAKINERFEVFNTSQSVMICYRTTYMTFFYLTEEVLSTYYDLTTKPHKFLKSTNPTFKCQSSPIKAENLQQFNELYNSLEDKIKILHKSISGNDKYMGMNSTLIDISDMLQLSSNHQKKKGLTDCIKTYEKANQIIREAEESVDNYITQTDTTTQLPSKSSLPSLTRNIGLSKNEQGSTNASFNFDDDKELNKLKNDVDTLQNNLNQVNQQIRVANSNDFSPSKSYRSPPRRNQVLQPTAPVSTRNASTSSPRTIRNRLKMMQRKVDEGDVMAMYSLGACYALGDGVPENKEKALYYYTLAAEKGNKNAQYAAAACHSYGKGTSIDKNKAFELYLQAAQQGHTKAQFAVAHFYEYGQGGAGKNHETAKEWYRKAAEQGHSAAKKFLDNCLSEAPVLADEE